MCGIIHVKRNGVPANKMVIKRYQKQKARGSDGFGFVELNGGIITGLVRATGEEEILLALEKSQAEEILFHHRTPTSTPNFEEATHPIVVKNKKLKYHYYVVHNGIIQNDTTMKTKHESEGYKYTTEIKKQFITSGKTYTTDMFNDSEALAIDFARAIENETELESIGSIALIALQVEKKTSKAVALYFGRNYGNPLKIEMQKEFVGISSESGKDIDADTLFRFDYSTGLLNSEEKDIGKLYTQQNAYGEVPLFGSWDYLTNTWKNAIYDKDYSDENYSQNFQDYDDDEIMIDDALLELEEALREAKRMNDYESIIEIEEDIEIIKAEAKDRAKKAPKRIGF